MVYDDLMIRNNTVPYYKTQTGHDRWLYNRLTLMLGLRSTGVGRRVDLPQPYSDLGSDYSSVLPYGF